MLYLPLVNRPKTIPGLVYRKSAWAVCSSFQWLWATWVRASTTSPTSYRTASSWTSRKSECPSTSGRWWSYFRLSSYDIFYDFVPIPGSFHLLNQVHYCHFVYRRKIITYSISYMSILYEGYRRIEWHFKENSAVKNLPCTFIRTRDLSTRVCLTSCWLVTTFNSFWFRPHGPFQVASTLRASHQLLIATVLAVSKHSKSLYRVLNSSAWTPLYE